LAGHGESRESRQAQNAAEYAFRAGCPPRCAYRTREPGSIRPSRTRSISAAIDFPS